MGWESIDKNREAAIRRNCKNKSFLREAASRRNCKK
jgi:hypothetical protein